LRAVRPTAGRASARPTAAVSVVVVTSTSPSSLLLCGLRDSRNDLSRRRLAGELVRGRGVESLTDRTRERDVEVELDERRVRASLQHRPQVRVGDRALRSPPHRQSEARRTDALLHARAVDVREELRTLWLRRLRRAGEAVAAAEQRAGCGLAARDVRECEPAEEARDLAIWCQRLHDAWVPVAL